MVAPARLDLDRREHTWDSLSDQPVDVLVIGGGVTGAGVALDAATRGLSVLLVEQRDYASGTSSRSSKLFHGGLRYLEQLNFALVRSALRERDLMVERLGLGRDGPPGLLGDGRAVGALWGIRSH